MMVEKVTWAVNKQNVTSTHLSAIPWRSRSTGQVSRMRCTAGSSGAQNVWSGNAVGRERTLWMQMSTGLDALLLPFSAQVFVDYVVCLRIHGLLLDPSELPVIHSILRHGHGCLFFLFVVVEPLCKKPFFLCQSCRKLLDPLYPVHEMVVLLLDGVVSLEQGVILFAVRLGVRICLRCSRASFTRISIWRWRRFTVIHRSANVTYQKSSCALSPVDDKPPWRQAGSYRVKIVVVTWFV